MKRLFVSVALGTLALFAVSAAGLAQDRDDHNQDHGASDHSQRDPRSENHQFTDHDHDSMSSWYQAHRNNLPRGLAARDRLSASLEAKLVVHVDLIPDLRRRIHPLPADFIALLPPAPYGCEYVALGGHVVLIDIGTYYVYDIFTFNV